MTYKWGLTDKKEQLYHELQTIETKFANMRCACKSTSKCTFCGSRTKALQYLNQVLNQIDVTPLYKIRLERSLHYLSSHGYPEFTFPNLISLKKRLSYFKGEIMEFSNCHPSVISNDTFEILELALILINSLNMTH